MFRFFGHSLGHNFYVLHYYKLCSPRPQQFYLFIITPDGSQTFSYTNSKYTHQ